MTRVMDTAAIAIHHKIGVPKQVEMAEAMLTEV